MSIVVKSAGIGAGVGFVGVTLFAVGEMLGRPGRPETWVVIVLAMAMGGILAGVPAGAALGVIIGVFVRRHKRQANPSALGANQTAPQLTQRTTQAPVQPDAPTPRPQWIGVPNEPVEVVATVLDVAPIRNPRATKAVRYQHTLRADSGGYIVWLANEPRGLDVGRRVRLSGTVKAHSWAPSPDGPVAITDVWYCSAQIIREPPPQPQTTPQQQEPKLSPDQPKLDRDLQGERLKAQADERARAAAALATQRRAQEDSDRRNAKRALEDAKAQKEEQPAPLAPLSPAPTRTKSSAVDLQDPERLNKVLAELDALPGLEAVAERVRAMARRITIDQSRRQQGLRVAEPGLHCLFIGPPGTGKTSVARIWGRVLAATGLLPSGHVVEVDRSNLVGQHIGSTGPKTLAAMETATGGVLFIDEAYSLAPGDHSGQDFGAEAVAALLKAMEDRRGTVAVVAAGYDREMTKFLHSNTGLAGRFSHRVEFPHYNGAALAQIADAMAKSSDYQWDDRALALLGLSLTRLSASPPDGWANARSVRGLLDGAVSAQVDRLSANSYEPTRETLSTLTEEDARLAIARLYPQAI